MTQINNDKFGEFILELRKEKGLTQKELAEKHDIKSFGQEWHIFNKGNI